MTKLNLNPDTARRVAAVFGVLGVALGAFGAHALKARLALNGTAAIWDKAVLYHFIHTIMLYVLAGRPAAAWWCFLAGIVIFSGSLYLLAATNGLWLGAITPVGGVGFIAGWCLLAGRRKGGSED